jgi:hypothetical protein
MNEQEVRALVRDAIERHLGRPGQDKGVRPLFSPDERELSEKRVLTPLHASHIILDVVPGSAIDEGMCLIEPAVRCNHCGFCQSYGH